MKKTQELHEVPYRLHRVESTRKKRLHLRKHFPIKNVHEKLSYRLRLGFADTFVFFKNYLGKR